MTQQIVWPYNRPFSDAGESTSLDTGYFPVAIDGKEYLVDWPSGLYRRFSVDVLRTRQNRQQDENLLLEPEVWRSVLESWHQGAGQTRHDRESSLPYRYFSSKGVDPWNRWGFNLLNKTRNIQAVGEDVWMVSVLSGLAVIDGTELRLYRNNLDQTPFTETLPSAPTAITSDGLSVYVALEGGTVRKYLLDPSTSTYGSLAPTYVTYGGLASGPPTYADILNNVDPILPVTFATLPGDASMLQYMKGFVIAGVDNELYDISTGTADSTTLIYEHPLLTHQWVTGTDGLAAGYLLGGQGDKWKVYWITVRDDAATLNPPVVAAPLPEGEIGRSLGSYLGFVLIGTDNGVRFATPAGDNTLTYGRLIISGSPVVAFEGQDRFVWFGIGGSVRDNEEALRQPEAGLARLDLSEFTAPLTPAYASDLIAGDDVAGRATYVATFNNRRVFAVPGVGVFEEIDEVLDDGWLVEGIITQGAFDQKIALYSSLMTEPLRGRVALDYAYESLNYEQLVEVSALDSVSTGNIYMEGRRFSAIIPRIRLYASEESESPRVTRLELRSTPVIGSAHEWQVPLLLAEYVDLDNVVQARDLHEDLDHLLRLVESGRLLTYREGDRTYRCYCPGYEWRPESPSADGALRGVFVMRLRSIR